MGKPLTRSVKGMWAGITRDDCHCPVSWAGAMFYISLIRDSNVYSRSVPVHCLGNLINLYSLYTSNRIHAQTRPHYSAMVPQPVRLAFRKCFRNGVHLRISSTCQKWITKLSAKIQHVFIAKLWSACKNYFWVSPLSWIIPECPLLMSGCHCHYWFTAPSNRQSDPVEGRRKTYS